MAVTRKFGGKVYKYRGSDVRLFEIREQANKLRKQGLLVRVVKTGKGKNRLYTLYVR